VPKHRKAECVADAAYGCPPGERDLEEYVARAVVLLDKPSGPTSRGAVEAVQKLLGAAKGGHGGTLDPKVTGVLPVLLGRSTKVAGLLLGSVKTYEGEMALHASVSAAHLEEGMRAFRGVIRQMPPRRSRVRRAVRERTIYSFDVTARDERRAAFTVTCQGGTYVRKLVHDLGQALGCGAHMASLRRTRLGCFGLDECVTLDELAGAAATAQADGGAMLRRMVRPVEEIVCRLLPQLVIDDGAVHSVSTGYPLAAPGVCALDDFGRGSRVAIMTGRGELVAIAVAQADSQDILAADHGVAASVRTVLISSDAYPKTLLRNN